MMPAMFLIKINLKYDQQIIMAYDLTKRYYKIKDVAEFLGVPQSTLRFWEREFPECTPSRNSHNIRYYTESNIEILRIIHYLLKVKGLKIEAAKEELKANRKNLSKRMEVIDLLKETRDDLQRLLDSLEKRK